jgi:hypothetical protein
MTKSARGRGRTPVRTAAAQPKRTDGEDRRRPGVVRTAAEDAQHRAGRAAHETPEQTEARRGPHQRAVEAMTGGTPYVLSRAQARALLTALDLDPDTLVTARADREGAVDGQGNPVVESLHQHKHVQAEGGLTAKLVRHYVKWLQPEGRFDKRTDDEITVTIPLADDEVDTLNRALGRGRALRPYASDGQEAE